jgi:predicted membrane protein
MSRRKQRTNPGVVVGLFIICIGLALLLANLGLMPQLRFRDFFPVALILVGVVNLANATHGAGRLYGLAFLAAGGWWLLGNLGLIHWGFWEFWPVLLILLGIVFVWQAYRPRDRGEASLTSELNEVAIFGGSNRVIRTEGFQGGDALAVFGGVELDLRQSRMAPGEITISANAMFGGIELRVPDNWTVHTAGSAIFGGFEDKTRQPREEDDGRYVLTVKGMAIFGGVSVAN